MVPPPRCSAATCVPTAACPCGARFQRARPLQFQPSDLCRLTRLLFQQRPSLAGWKPAPRTIATNQSTPSTWPTPQSPSSTVSEFVPAAKGAVAECVRRANRRSPRPTPAARDLAALRPRPASEHIPPRRRRPRSPSHHSSARALGGLGETATRSPDDRTTMSRPMFARRSSRSRAAECEPTRARATLPTVLVTTR